MTRVGQAVRYAFSSYAGQNYVTLWVTSSFAGGYSFFIYDPNNVQLPTSDSVSFEGGASVTKTVTLYPPALPGNATYSIRMEPSSNSTGSVSIQLRR